ncbi:timeless protein-domain-containing protein [Immersiella caudata]|uniref:Topoisomerase 1-associated factor 1 n=1 Tax=Immersiella caudata TaxID=314043 RepID=A0AA40C6S0_9PEZI|nr:timeless protein-domain-containing protein [Immersiella caudata]
METAELNNNNDVVHPEVRAHISSLVSALGGLSVDDEEGAYKLGDDALEVLRDLKRWIRFYDEKTNRMDVARCLAEANLVGNDLLQILATWPANESDSIYKFKIALACFEVMVPLTWPIERDRETMTVNHHRHLPVLQLAQLGYKRAILNFDAAPILGTAVRVALPSMAMPIGDRAPRDQGIIKLILYFIRNVAMIGPPPGIKLDGDESQISRSALIDAFSFQDISLTILTVASNMGEDFRTEDVIVMEILFHLVKRVNSSKLFVSEKEANKAKANELSAAMSKEAAMLRSYNKNAPTRHSRFGTMIWVKRESGKLSTVTGQDALLDPAARERKMDKSKTFRAPRRARKEEMEPKDLGPPVSLDERARSQLGSFVSEFLDSGFNPLFAHVRKSIDREALHVVDYHSGQFFYLVAWFLEAERNRRKARQGTKAPTPEDDVGTFNLVAEVLNQEMFITLNRALDRAYNDKDWQLLSTVMRCLTQILLTVQDMSDSGNEDDEEIANNILSRLFYEETTHDAVANIVRTYKDQGFEYLDACTELSHTYLRILETYSKQNVDLQVRSKRRTRRKKKASRAAAGEDAGDHYDADDDSANDQQSAEKTSQERKFDFKRFANRFTPQGVVDTFVALTKYYRDLDDSQLKRAHRFFYRVAFKQEMGVMLFRLDIIHLFYNMIKGPEPLDRNSSVYKDWEELAKQIIKKCIRKLEERPALFTELLFSKINSTAHYLEYGYEKQTISSNPRPAAELEFKWETNPDKQVAIVVGTLLDKSQTDHLVWMKKVLSEAETERRSWENAEKAMIEAGRADGETPDQPVEDATPKAAPHFTIRPDTDTRRSAMFKNPHLRLLMKLVGFERLTPTLDETPDSSWVIPGHISADSLKDSVDLINKAEFNPPTFDDGQSAEDQLRRKSAARKRAAYDDDMNPLSGDEDDEAFLFAPGGPTARKSTAEDAKRPPKKRQRRLRRAGSDDEGPTQEEVDEKARARRQKELEKLRRIKSEMYVDPADDETTDEETREERERNGQKQGPRRDISRLLAEEEENPDADLLFGVDSDEESDAAPAPAPKKKQMPKRKERKRSSDVALGESSDEEEVASSSKPAKRSKKSAKKRAFSEDDEDEEMGGLSQSSSRTADERARSDVEAETVDPDRPESRGNKAPPGDADDEDEDVAPVKQRARVRAGFIVDSSDEQ